MSRSQPDHNLLGLHDDDLHWYQRSISVPAIRKKSDPGRITAPFKTKHSHTRSPVLSKKASLSPDGSVSSLTGGGKHRTPSGGSGGVSGGSGGGIHSGGAEEQEPAVEETIFQSFAGGLEASPASENGAKSPDAPGPDEVEGPMSSEQKSRRSAIDMYLTKVEKTKALINQEHASKESNVNAYLRQAPTVDEQQRQKMKLAFEKQNQKSGAVINQLQKKLDLYQKKIDELERPISGHKTNRLRDMGQGIKASPANLPDAIRQFGLGVVGNIKGAKDSIVSKPREFAHLIKNKFGSADNIHSRSKLDDNDDDEFQRRSLRFSDDDNSSLTSGSGLAMNEVSAVSQQASLAANELLIEELSRQRENKERIMERLNRIQEEFESYKNEAQNEVSNLKSAVEEERYRYRNLEDQLNDLTELHQNEIINLRQDIVSATEKIEYQLDERIHDTQDILESCSTRVTKMELHQQQQQVISIEGMENVTFRTLLTKLLNVVLAVVAVILVFVSTIANLLTPFLLSGGRILATVAVIAVGVYAWKYWDDLTVFIQHKYQRYIH